MPAIRIWSKPKVIEEITELQKRKEPLNARYIQSHYRALFNAGERHWGSWGNAIEATGIDYQSVKITDPVVSWSNKLIINSERRKIVIVLYNLQNQGISKYSYSF